MSMIARNSVWLLLTALLIAGVVATLTNAGFIRDAAVSLMASDLSEQFAAQYAWLVPSFQSLHIIAAGVTFGSVLMVALKVMGIGSKSLTVRETSGRYGPWVWGSIIVLLLSGAVLTIAEPERQFMTLSFRLKMLLLLAFIIIAGWFQSAVRRNADQWELRRPFSTKLVAFVVILMLVAIVILARFIAFDPNIWGCASPFDRLTAALGC